MASRAFKATGSATTVTGVGPVPAVDTTQVPKQTITVMRLFGWNGIETGGTAAVTVTIQDVNGNDIGYDHAATSSPMAGFHAPDGGIAFDGPAKVVFGGTGTGKMVLYIT